MPHYGNDHAGSGIKINSHEDKLAELLVKIGFTKIELMSGSKTFVKGKRKNQTIVTKLFPLLGRENLKAAISSDNIQESIKKLVPGMKPGTFIMQPSGSQSPPDFLVRDFSGLFILIEAKSSDTNVFPVWNDNCPKQELIYIFSCGVYNQTTIWKGNDFLDLNRQQVLELILDKFEQTSTWASELLSNTPDPFNRGLTLGIRRKFSQSGGSKYYDCFKHDMRKKCEQNVLDFALKN